MGRVVGPVAQSVASQTADPGVVSFILSRYYTFVEIDHEISTVILGSPPSADSRRVVISYKRKHVHKVLVNRLVKLAQKVWLGDRDFFFSNMGKGPDPKAFQIEKISVENP